MKTKKYIGGIIRYNIILVVFYQIFQVMEKDVEIKISVLLYKSYGIRFYRDYYTRCPLTVIDLVNNNFFSN